MIQVIGGKKCRITQKALRFFKERNVKVHFLDLEERSLSEGELDNCARAAGGVEKLLDTNSAAYSKRGLAYMDYDVREELLANNGLLKTPIVRQGKRAAVSDDPTAWKQMAETE